MTKSVVSIGILVMFLLAAMTFAGAQEPAAPTPAKTPPPTSAPPTRDPTVPDADLRSAIDRSGLASPGAGRSSTVKLPEVVLRGRIQVEGKPVRAMIEVGASGIHIVTTGSQLTVDAGSDKSLVLQVVRLTLEEIEIEIPALHQKIVIR